MKSETRSRLYALTILFPVTSLVLIAAFALGFLTFWYINSGEYVPDLGVLSGDNSYIITIPHAAYRGATRCGNKVCIRMEKLGAVSSKIGGGLNHEV